MQGEFYVDSDPEKEEIKGAVETIYNESKLDLPVIEEVLEEGEELPEKLPEEPKISKPLTHEQKSLLKFELLKNLFYLMRIFGSLIALIDIFAKIAYYDYSKFASIHIK
jgi:hypothetical protein